MIITDHSRIPRIDSMEYVCKIFTFDPPLRYWNFQNYMWQPCFQQQKKSEARHIQPLRFAGCSLRPVSNVVYVFKVMTGRWLLNFYGWLCVSHVSHLPFNSAAIMMLSVSPSDHSALAKKKEEEEGRQQIKLNGTFLKCPPVSEFFQYQIFPEIKFPHFFFNQILSISSWL